MLTLDHAMESYARVDAAWQEYRRWYDREYYRSNRDTIRDRKNTRHKQLTMALTPEEHENQLARRREVYKMAKERSGKDGKD